MKNPRLFKILEIILLVITIVSVCGCGVDSPEIPSNTVFEDSQDFEDVENPENVEIQAEPTETKEVELNLPSPYRYYCNDTNCTGHALSELLSAVYPTCNSTMSLDLTFVGDCLLATNKGANYEGSLNWYGEHKDPSYFFENVYSIFSSDDFTIANLENVLTDRNLSEVDKGEGTAFWFKAPTRHAEILNAASIEAVSLANNHYGDYGSKGRADTVEALINYDIPYGDNDNILYLEKDGYTVAIVCHGLWGEWQADTIVEKLKEAEENSDFQVVYYHGGKEAIHDPEDWKIRASRKLVDAGADLVIGNHPHVLQPMEMYNGVRIIYSLGNFCFGGNRRPENRTVIYQIHLDIDKITHELKGQVDNIIPCYVYTGDTNNWQPAIIEDPEIGQKVIDFMNWKTNSPL